MTGTSVAKLLLRAHRSHSTVERARSALTTAIDTHRSNLAACFEAGVSYSELGRQFGTSPARVREQVLSAPKQSR